MPDVQPVVEPISLAEAKDFMRIDPDYNFDDAIISIMISANREYLEQELGLSLVPKIGLKYKYTKPCCGYRGTGIYLPYGPVNSAIATYNTDGSNYELVNEGPDEYYPYYRFSASVNVVYNAGNWEGNFPASLKLALLMMVATNYENRENFVIGETVNETVQNAKQLAYKYSRNLYLS